MPKESKNIKEDNKSIARKAAKIIKSAARVVRNKSAMKMADKNKSAMVKRAEKNKGAVVKRSKNNKSAVVKRSKNNKNAMVKRAEKNKSAMVKRVGNNESAEKETDVNKSVVNMTMGTEKNDGAVKATDKDNGDAAKATETNEGAAKAKDASEGAAKALDKDNDGSAKATDMNGGAAKAKDANEGAAKATDTNGDAAKASGKDKEGVNSAEKNGEASKATVINMNRRASDRLAANNKDAVLMNRRATDKIASSISNAHVIANDYDAEKDALFDRISGKLKRHYGSTIGTATIKQKYNAIALSIRDDIMEKWAISREDLENNKLKQVYYLSLEFLIGRSLGNNLQNLLKTDMYRDVCKELDMTLNELEEQENDAGLGNGGLGRLAACFMDSLATLRLNATGCGIRYDYGLFKQKILDGYQIELPDPWLEDGNIWEIAMPEDKVEVHFGGDLSEEWEDGMLKQIHENYETVTAVPYDMPICGYESKVINRLRLWRAHASGNFDMSLFNSGDYLSASREKERTEALSRVLYPEDNHFTGKTLRLKQQYFFVSATIQWIVKEYKKIYGTNFFKMSKYIAIHINDTHPALAIPEMMRILIDEEKLHWNEAWDITRSIFGYTNHTIMVEALEVWPVSFFRQNLPRIYSIISEINETYCRELWERYPGEWDKIASMAVLADDQVKMANLCVVMSKNVNGVSELHTEIIKNSVFSEYSKDNPEKFVNVTNGVTHRRWLLHANPGLASLITETIGDDWILSPEELVRIEEFAGNAAFQEKFAAVKRENKQKLARFITDTTKTVIDPDSIFDVQIKRMHEYKRQLLNVIHILYLYNKIKRDPSYRPCPRTFIFGAKASPGYHRAKLIIKLINSVAALINGDPQVSSLIKIVFVENYGVTIAERIIPAADISEQISTAGKEASGTGNMKLMLNGAVTLGTLDGANVEIRNIVGDENIYIFGLTSEEVNQLYLDGNYKSRDIYEADEGLREAVNMLINGKIEPDKEMLFNDIFNSLLFDENGLSDQYLLLKDFESYAGAHDIVQRDYMVKEKWVKKAIINTARAGYFSSDRAIREYNEKIWGLN